MTQDDHRPADQGDSKPVAAAGSGSAWVWVVLFVLAVGLGGGLIWYFRGQAKPPTQIAAAPQTTRSAEVRPPQAAPTTLPKPTVEVSPTRPEVKPSPEQEKRKEELGLKKSVDAVVRGNEAIKVEGKVVPVDQIVAQAKEGAPKPVPPAAPKEPRIKEETIAPATRSAEVKPQVAAAPTTTTTTASTSTTTTTLPPSGGVTLWSAGIRPAPGETAAKPPATSAPAPTIKPTAPAPALRSAEIKPQAAPSTTATATTKPPATSATAPTTKPAAPAPALRSAEIKPQAAPATTATPTTAAPATSATTSTAPSPGRGVTLWSAGIKPGPGETAATTAPAPTTKPPTPKPAPAEVPAQVKDTAAAVKPAAPEKPETTVYVTVPQPKPQAAQPAKAPDVYALRLVRPGDNLWQIHYQILKEYLTGRGVALRRGADRPEKSGRSSGVGRILKYAEHQVLVYNVKTGQISRDLDLIQPGTKIAIFNMTHLQEILRELDAKKIRHVRFDGKRLFLEE